MVGKRDRGGEARGKKRFYCDNLRQNSRLSNPSRVAGPESIQWEERRRRRGARQEVILLRQSETELSAIESITCRRARVDSMVGKRDGNREARGKK
ncbi:hypothetical protein J6590_016293 [Homalodisca vitripennis]|nr:hypothetical protein J6590_016293 [Homalodisca vitripennis]